MWLKWLKGACPKTALSTCSAHQAQRAGEGPSSHSRVYTTAQLKGNVASLQPRSLFCMPAERDLDIALLSGYHFDW